MANPAVIFGDPLAGTLESLKGRLPGLSDDGATYGTRDPDTNASGTPPIPYIRVTVDGSQGKYPVYHVATMRVAVWHSSDAKALALAQRARAVLLSDRGNDHCRSYGEGVGPIPSSDPDTGAPLCFFTVSARLRPQLI